MLFADSPLEGADVTGIPNLNGEIQCNLCKYNFLEVFHIIFRYETKFCVD